MARTDMIYVVYPYAADRYQSVKVHKRIGNAAIHKAIAAFENDEERSGRRWNTTIEAGSFNIAKIENAANGNEAIAQAKEQGLTYEPKPTVLARYKQRQEGLQRDFDRMRHSGKVMSSSGNTINEAFSRFFDQHGPKR